VTPVYPIEEVTLNSGTQVNPLRFLYRIEPAVAAVVLVGILPLALVIAGMIVILSRRSPLIRHTRVGWRGATLSMLKFRTMWGNDAPDMRTLGIDEVDDVVPVAKNRLDPRVTSGFAAWCRRYSIDELPQIYHVLRGEMSFVGPRPITRSELDTYYGPCTDEVLYLKPGITGLWQIMGRNHLSYSQRRRLDLLLVRQASPRLYFTVLLRSVPRVITGYGAC